MILKLITEIYRPERAAQTMFSYAEARGVRVKLESQQPISRRVVACKRNVMARVSRSSSCSRARSNLIERNNVKRGLKTANGTVAGKSGVYTPVERLPRTNKKYFLAPTHIHTHTCACTRLRRLIFQMHGHSLVPTRRTNRFDIIYFV